MSDFKRARSVEQKEQRMQEIKAAVDKLFAEKAYQDITITTIADELSLTRANLYQYISTKEEIFLELSADKRDNYYDALLAAFPENSGYSIEVVAEVWASILNAHRDYLRYSDILHTIIETNVSIERLIAFKKNYYERTYELSERIGSQVGLSKEDTYSIYVNVHYHAVGIESMSSWDPLIAEALIKENIKVPEINFRENLREYILMNLKHYLGKNES